jgi:hypothetical protein
MFYLNGLLGGWVKIRMRFGVATWTFAVASVGMALVAHAQTNMPGRELFAVPVPGLRAVPVSAAASPVKALEDELGPDIRSVPPKTIWQGGYLRSELLISSAGGDDDFRQYFLTHGSSGLERPAPPLSPVAHAFDSVFRPVEIRIGRTATLNCSIWTAIERKNPLCLLNPVFFNISW